MVSQLVVKSEVALNWGGKAIWVLQDVLVNYISQTTGLDIYHFRSDTTSDVNILSCTYGGKYTAAAGVITLEVSDFFADPISGGSSGSSFQDMIRAPALPSSWRLWQILARRTPTAILPT